MDSFQKLRKIIQEDNYFSPQSKSWGEPCHQRLIDALKNIKAKQKLAAGDIASLVRHVLRREDELQGGSRQTLKVPRREPWPTDREIWGKHGFDVLREDWDSYLIRARPWQPEWLDLSDRYPPDAPTFKEEERRNYSPEPGDPFLSVLDRDSYRNVGQREAVRAVLTAPKGSTLAIDLPTGSGKSLVAELPALLESQTGGISVVVVPTTALALDRERALSQWLHHPTAYYSSSKRQDRRKEIRDRVLAGSQRLIFTSPEGLINSLASCLYQAAESGMLKYLIIDEAHMVEQWGDEFRPAFQEIPGLRRDLLRIASFKTLLLTATLTESCLDTLETLFGEPGEFQVISAVQLRSEPAYWFAWCQNEEIRKQRLLEAVAHLPRPLIIYTTKVDDVHQWAEELSRAGFKRYKTMTGQSSAEQRLQLIEEWQNKQVDIVVATSAFGLGIDRSDVRAIIHACVPETIDRFYQEVGRGGRDGKASISLTLHTTQDGEIAKSLNEKSYITIERGLERWRSMFAKKENWGNGFFRVPIDIPPTLREGDIDMNSEQNKAWNIRTLTLMSRAGIIEIHAAKPPKLNAFKLGLEGKKILEKHRNSRIIRICNEYHLEPKIWETEVEPIRLKSQKWGYQNLGLMKEALRPRRCLSEIFAQTYTISPVDSSRNKVTVSKACGGCPYCRKRHQQTFSGIMPWPKPVWPEPYWEIGAELQRLIANEKLSIIFYDRLQIKNWKFHRDRAFKWLIERGVRNLVIPPELKLELIEELRPNSINNGFIFLFEKYEPIKMPPIPTLIFQETEISQRHLLLNDNSQAPRILMLPEDTRDPSREDRKLINIFSGRYFRFNHFYKEISL
jgi:superfamily II DNA/RNA helicase